MLRQPIGFLSMTGVVAHLLLKSHIALFVLSDRLDSRFRGNDNRCPSRPCLRRTGASSAYLKQTSSDLRDLFDRPISHLPCALLRCFVKFEFYYHHGVGQFIYWQVLQPQVGFVFYVIGRYQIHGKIHRITCV